MKSAIGVAMIIGGVVFGLWAGLWWAFIGGIVQVVEAVKVDPVSALDIAFGIARVVFASVIGLWSAVLLVVPGVALVSD